MQISIPGKIEILNYECICLSPYLDSGGVKTVAGGSTASDIPDLANWPWSTTISIERAFELFNNHIKKYSDAVSGKLKVSLPQHKFDALVSICYNIGIGGMSSSTFMKRVNLENSDGHICNAIKRWHKDNGRVVKGLVNRRNKECGLYTSGVYVSGGMVDLVPVSGRRKPDYSKGVRIDARKYM